MSEKLKWQRSSHLVVCTTCIEVALNPNVRVNQHLDALRSAVQGRRERQRAPGQVVQPLLVVPGRLPPSPALPRHPRLRPRQVKSTYNNYTYQKRQ